MAGTAAADQVARAGQRTGNKLSIYMFSGTADKLVPLGVMTQGAAAMGMEVHVFVTGLALRRFAREHHALPASAELADLEPAMAQGLAKARVANWDEMLGQAKALGAKVHACSMMMAVLGLAREDLADLVDDVMCASEFLQVARGGETFFI